MGSCGRSREVGAQPEVTVVGLVALWAGTAKGIWEGGRLSLSRSLSPHLHRERPGAERLLCAVPGPHRHLCASRVLVLGGYRRH